MNQLVEGLLAFSRLIRQPLNKQPVEIAALTRQALENLQAQQAGRQVEVTLGDLPPARADPVLLKQVLTNLLSNALKFTRGRPVARIEIGSTTSEEGEIIYHVVTTASVLTTSRPKTVRRVPAPASCRGL